LTPNFIMKNLSTELYHASHAKIVRVNNPKNEILVIFWISYHVPFGPVCAT